LWRFYEPGITAVALKRPTSTGFASALCFTPVRILVNWAKVSLHFHGHTTPVSTKFTISMLHSSRSQVLVHWTGRDIDARLKNGDVTPEDVRLAYADRLLKTLTTGLWLNRGEEVIVGPQTELTSYFPRVCFSEILLSRSDEHAGRYGRLGFGFGRRFIVEAGGSPVLYVRNSPKDRVVQIIGALTLRISNLDQEILLGPLGRQEGLDVDMTAVASDLWDSRTLIGRLLALVKAMSTEDTDDFEFLDEAEWRVVSYDDQPAYHIFPGTLFFGGKRLPNVESWKSAPQIVRNAEPPPSFYFSFQADDLALLVLPDEDTRSLVWDRPDFRYWHQSRRLPLQLFTIAECLRM
jgi:hypothetical protein